MRCRESPQPFWSGAVWLVFWWSEGAFHWQLFGQRPRQPATAARAFLRGRGSICPHNGRWSPASRTLWCHRTPAWFSCAIIPFLLLKAQWRAIRMELPGNFLAHTERASKGVLGKLLAWPPDYIRPMGDDVLLKRGTMSSCWRRKLSFFFSYSAASCNYTRMFRAWLLYPSVARVHIWSFNTGATSSRRQMHQFPPVNLTWGKVIGAERFHSCDYDTRSS